MCQCRGKRDATLQSQRQVAYHRPGPGREFLIERSTFSTKDAAAELEVPIANAFAASGTCRKVWAQYTDLTVHETIAHIAASRGLLQHLLKWQSDALDRIVWACDAF